MSVTKFPRREKRLAVIEVYEDHDGRRRARLLDMPDQVINDLCRYSDPGEAVSDRLRAVSKWMFDAQHDLMNQARDIEDEAFKVANQK